MPESPLFLSFAERLELLAEKRTKLEERLVATRGGPKPGRERILRLARLIAKLDSRVRLIGSYPFDG